MSTVVIRSKLVGQVPITQVVVNHKELLDLLVFTAA